MLRRPLATWWPTWAANILYRVTGTPVRRVDFGISKQVRAAQRAEREARRIQDELLSHLERGPK